MHRRPNEPQHPHGDRRGFLKTLGLGAAAAAGGFALDTRALAGTTQRPISDFLGAQGSTTIYVPPSPDHIGWFSAFDREPVLCASVDYAGLSNAYLEDYTAGEVSFGTLTDGTVTERRLADGRAEVTVVLHTKNALTYAFAVDFDIAPEEWFAKTPLLFGYRLVDVICALEHGANITPALADSQLKVVMRVEEPGADLPDLVAGEYELIGLSFRATAFGPLRTADGGEAGPGKCDVTQTGVLQAKFRGATADGFPCEKITVGPVGRK